MTEIHIPVDALGDPVFDSDEGTLTFYGPSASRIAQILYDAREERERAERKERLNATVGHFAGQYAHRDTSASGLRVAFREFATRVLDIYEVPR